MTAAGDKGGMMRRISLLAIDLILAVFFIFLPAFGQTKQMPAVLSIKERVEAVNSMTKMRLEKILPKVMTETGFDMWIILCNEDNLDPVFRTMIPYDTWCPITQLLVFSLKPGGELERLNLSRTDMRGLFVDAWDWRAWDSEQKESQWGCLARLIRERDPKKIAVNESEVIWGADGLTVTLRKKLEQVIGQKYARRLESGEKLATLWLETLLDEELALYERVSAVSHALIAETFSGRTITPGVTTLDDLLYFYLQRVADLGLEPYGWPWFRIRGRGPETIEKYGQNDTVIRRGDLLQCDAGIRYLRYYTDHCEWAYVLRPGEEDVPAGIKKVMAEGNRLQDIFLAEFKEGKTGNQILVNILKTANEKGLCSPKIYSHSIGLYLHEPGPLIGLPWEQKNTGGRGEVRLVANSTFTAELSVSCPVPEWGGRELRLALEQMVAYTAGGARFLDGRQTKFYIVH